MGRIIKDPKKIEVIIKGFANRHRIRILYILEDTKSLSVNEVAERSNIGFRSASQHLDKMYRGGLVSKSYSGPVVLHSLTSRGKSALEFIERFDRY
jgi:DNA-binding transcriptional ArsR family regulator